MFPKEKYVLKIASGSVKQCEVRWPTDEEWVRRARKQSTVQRRIGRAVTTEGRGIEDASAEMLAAIRLDKDGPEFDGSEAVRAISRLERCEVLSSERAGDKYTIVLSVPGGEVTHELRMPTQKDIQQYGRQTINRREMRNETITRIDLEPAAALYDKVHVSHSGYRAEVPIIHKDVAVMELLVRIEEDLAEDDDDLG